MISWALNVLQLNALRPKDIVNSSISICKSQQFFNILLFWRVISLLLTLATCITNVVHQISVNGQDWVFFLSFTNLCFILMAIYFLGTAIISFRDWRVKRYAYFVSVPGGNSTTESLLFGSTSLADLDDDILEDDDMEIQIPAPTSHKVFWILFEVGFSLALFIDIIFWATFIHYNYEPDSLVVVLHALNGILMMGELCLNSFKFIASHVVFVWLVLFVYAIEVVVWHSVDGRWAYLFLDPSNKIAFLYYPVLFIVATLTFFAGYLLTKVRDRKKTAKRFPLVDVDTLVF